MEDSQIRQKLIDIFSKHKVEDIDNNRNLLLHVLAEKGLDSIYHNDHYENYYNIIRNQKSQLERITDFPTTKFAQPREILAFLNDKKRRNHEAVELDIITKLVRNTYYHS